VILGKPEDHPIPAQEGVLIATQSQSTGVDVGVLPRVLPPKAATTRRQRVFQDLRQQRIIHLMILLALYSLIFRYFAMYDAIVPLKEDRVLDDIIGSP